MLEFLKAAAKVSNRTDKETFPPEIVSFALEYKNTPNLETERNRISTLLEGEGFDLFAYSSEDDPNILILQFQGLERQQSTGFLFQTAGELVEALDLVSSTPEIDPLWTDLTAPSENTEGVKEALESSCRSDASSPDDANWARQLMKVDRATSTFGADGSGILIAQPDTGVAEHREIDDGIDRTRAYNFIDNSSNPTDPLLATMRSPGHGTATSSVVISRSNRIITGSAPGATLVPIRCVNSVIVGNSVPVAKAIDHARKKKCNIVTMSLGGPIGGFTLKRAIKRAVDDGMIVMAAAGNCVKIVIYPARFDSVIAVAAVDSNKKRWKGSSSGKDVDVAAPGENVHVARRPAGSDQSTFERIDTHGQGTSYAVALTAGCAALWLSHFGVDAVKAEAGNRHTTVQELFRTALKTTAQRPNGWDDDNMGAGIVDALELLSLNLQDIPTVAETQATGPLMSVFDQVFGSDNFSSEASYVDTDWSIRLATKHAGELESALPASLSPRLAAAFGQNAVPGFPGPATHTAPATPPVSKEEAIRRLVGLKTGDLESASSMSPEQARETIKTEGIDSVMQNVKSQLESVHSAATKPINKEVGEKALVDIEKTLVALTNPDQVTDFSEDSARFGLEALVRLTGRPALRVDTPQKMMADPNIGKWASHLLPTSSQWRKLTDAVGRIDVKSNGRWRHTGTGFVIKDNVVMTNRHVLDAFAEPIPMPGGKQKFIFTKEVSIVFDNDAKDDAQRFKIKGVVTAGAKRIGRYVNMNNLDMAVLEIESNNGSNDHPAAIEVNPQSTSNSSIVEIMLAGYPARPGWSSAPNDDPEIALKYWNRIGELYGDEYGVKYISPGEIMKRPGSLAADPHGWAFSHDATTLAGNSGSGIITLGGGMNFCGLHFGGSTLTQNLAHDIETVFEGNIDAAFNTEFLNG